MQGLRDDFLAGAVLAGDQNVGVGGADAGDRLQHGLHGGRGGDEFRTALGPEQAVFRCQTFGLLQRAMQFDLRAQDGEQAFVLPGLLDEVARAAAHGFDRQFHVAPCGHDDDRNSAVEGDDFREQIEAFLSGGRVARVVQIDQHRVVRTAERERLAHQAGERAVSTAYPCGRSSNSMASRICC